MEAVWYLVSTIWCEHRIESVFHVPVYFFTFWSCEESWLGQGSQFESGARSVTGSVTFGCSWISQPRIRLSTRRTPFARNGISYISAKMIMWRHKWTSPCVPRSRLHHGFLLGTKMSRLGSGSGRIRNLLGTRRMRKYSSIYGSTALFASHVALTSLMNFPCCGWDVAE